MNCSAIYIKLLIYLYTCILIIRNSSSENIKLNNVHAAIINEIPIYLQFKYWSELISKPSMPFNHLLVNISNT